MIAFTIGYKDGNALLASTMAFATLCCSRLFHGFNCKSNRPVVFTKRVFNNIYLIGAFVIGMILITLVVTVQMCIRDRCETMSNVIVKENETLDSALRRFKRNCAKAGIQQEIRKREHYEKPSVRRKKKSEAARKRKYN